MTPMPPPAMPGQPPAQPSNVPFPSPEDLAQIEQDTGYSKERILADVKRTRATDKSQLYPRFYGEGNPGIEPDAAAIGAGYDEAPDQAAPPPVDANEPPQRAAARAAMSGDRAAMMQQEMGESPADEAAEPPQQQAMEQQMGTEMDAPDPEALGIGARARKPFDVHERARQMKARPY